MQVAMEMRGRYADGVCFVGLAPISDPGLVISSIVYTLGIQQGGMQTLLEAVQAWLGDKQFLLLLDNFEQIVSAAPLLAELLVACPRLAMVVTSREVLHLQAEYRFPVPPLALPDLAQLPEREQLAQYAAVALFVQRAQAILPDFQLTQTHAQAIAEICVRLDGLPLALELAAARVRVLPPQALLARLSQRFQVLTGGRRTMPERQQTLRNTIQWSYDLLDEEEQRLFRWLAVFVGGCTLEAVEALYSTLGGASGPHNPPDCDHQGLVKIPRIFLALPNPPPSPTCWINPHYALMNQRSTDNDASTNPARISGAGSVLDEVASLIDKSLLQQTEQEGGEPRLAMLETTREYGWGCLAANGELEVIQQAHAAYYLRLAEEAEPELEGPQQSVWLDRLEREHDNLRAALQWALERGEAEESRGEMALRLGGALRRFWRTRGHLSEGRTYLERALAGSGGVAASVRAKALQAAADVALNQSDYARGETLCKESLVLCRELKDRRGIAFSLRLLGWAVWNSGDPVTARSLMEEALALRREVGDKEHIAESLCYLAMLAGYQGKYARGRTLIEEGIMLFRQVGDQRGMAWSLLLLAEMLFSSQGDQVAVRSLLEESLMLCRELHEKGGMAEAFVILGQVTLDQGDATTARALAEESLALHRELGDRWGMIQSLCLFAQVEASQDNYVAARAHYVEGLVLCKEADDKWSTISCLEGLACVVAAQREPAWAARLWGAAESLGAVISARSEQGGLFWMALPRVERATYERSVTTARSQLGAQAFTAAWQEGRAMTPEQALAVQEPEAPPEHVPAVAWPTTMKTSPTYPAELTAREIEVLRLVAQGMTDAQVAEQLVISPRTVNWHLTSIYSKLGVSSRSAATRYVIEHRLV